MFIHSNISLNNAAILKKCIADITTYNLPPTPMNTGLVLNNCFSSWEVRYIYNNPDQPHNWLELQPLIKEIKSKGINLIDGSFFVILGKDSWVIPHNHPNPNNYVCVYNVSIDDEHPHLEFLNPETGVWEPSKCVTGDYIIFNGTQKHKIDLQRTQKLRCMIAINC